jgi:hypothetical protein
MKNRLMLAAGCAVLWAVPAGAWVQHRAYTTHSGTYVAPHMQTAPNGTRLDNWSTRGNANPLTGRRGTEPAYPMPHLRSDGTYR